MRAGYFWLLSLHLFYLRRLRSIICKKLAPPGRTDRRRERTVEAAAWPSGGGGGDDGRVRPSAIGQRPVGRRGGTGRDTVESIYWFELRAAAWPAIACTRHGVAPSFIKLYPVVTRARAIFRIHKPWMWWNRCRADGRAGGVVEDVVR